MSSLLHEGLLQPFQNRPALAAQLLADAFAVKLPAWQRAVLADTKLTDPVPTEYQADAVIVLFDRSEPATPPRQRRTPRNPDPAAGTPVRAIVVEAQLQYEPRKSYSWPAYVANQRARLECPTTLMVVCPDPREASLCARPIHTGHPDWILRPLVMGPNQIPVITNPEIARHDPDLSVLSALAHAGTHPRRRQVLEAFATALQDVESDLASIYHELVYAALPVVGRRFLEELMRTLTLENLPLVSPFARSYAAQGRAEGLSEGRAQGLAEGRAEAVLAMLDARGIDVPDEVLERITGCADLNQLDAWIRLAATVDSIGELFVD